jgi:hypothetical protein
MNTYFDFDPALQDLRSYRVPPRNGNQGPGVGRGLLFIVLSVATAVGLFASGWVLSNPTVADPRPAAAEVVVESFYAAVNQAIRSGDTSALDATIDEHAEMHGSLASIAPDRAGLTRYLLSLHASNPQLELRVNGMTITGSRAVVDLDMLGADSGSFLGGSLPKSGRWGATDGLRIGNGRVLELWSEASGVALLETVAQNPTTFATVLPRNITLDRLTIEPFGSFVAAGKNEMRWLVGESGNLTITSKTTRYDLIRAPLSLEPDRRSLKPGQLLPLPAWSQTEVRNTGKVTGTLLVLKIASQDPSTGSSSSHYLSTPPTPGDDSLPGWWGGSVRLSQGIVSLEPVTSSGLEALPSDHLNVTLAQATLTPGALLSDIEVTGPTLLAVKDGATDLVFDDGSTAIDPAKAGYHNIIQLMPENGAVIPPGSRAYLHNPSSEPIVVTFIALLPDDVTTGGDA